MTKFDGDLLNLCTDVSPSIYKNINSKPEEVDSELGEGGVQLFPC